MKKFSPIYLLFVLLLSLTTTFQSCDNDSGDNTSRIQIKLVDEPGDYLEVNVEIIDIQYKSSEEDSWSSFSPANGYPINVDLTELIAGNNLLLVDEVLPSGMIKQIRLVLSDNNTLLIEGNEELVHLDTPSSQQSGLKLDLNQELESGYSYTFILDWVVQESIVKAGQSGKYILKPVINVIAEVNSGSISGMVVETIDESQVAKENVTVGVYALDDTFITDTMTDENGNFLVQGIAGGNYKLKITVEGYEEYQSEEILVTAGETADVGTIELVLTE